MPRLMTLKEFLSGGNWQAISRYKKTGILPSYVQQNKKKKMKPSTTGNKKNLVGLTGRQRRPKPKPTKVAKKSKTTGYQY